MALKVEVVSANASCGLAKRSTFVHAPSAVTSASCGYNPHLHTAGTGRRAAH